MKTVMRPGTSRRALLLLLCSLVILTPNTVVAQTNSSSKAGKQGITLSPPLKELTLGPGLVEAQTKITLTNTTNRDMYASLRLVDFEASNELGDITFSALGTSSSKYALAKWMSLPGGNTVTLASGKSTDVVVRIDNSKDLAPGGHYGAVIASISSSATQPAPNTVTLKQEVVSLLFVKKTGGESYGLQLEGLKTNGGSEFPYQAEMKFKNTGNVHVVPRGYIEITNSKGKLISKGIINPESTIVLPDGSRQFVTIMQPVANPGRWGNYTVTAYYRYDGQEKFTAQSITYTKKLLTNQSVAGIVALTGVIILVLGTWLYRRGLVYKFRRSTK